MVPTDIIRIRANNHNAYRNHFFLRVYLIDSCGFTRLLEVPRGHFDVLHCIKHFLRHIDTLNVYSKEPFDRACEGGREKSWLPTASSSAAQFPNSVYSQIL